MAGDLKVATPDMNVCDAAALMTHYDIGSLPVTTEDGALRGIVTDRDLVTRVLATREDPASVRIGDVATTRTIVTTTPETSIADAMATMSEHKVKRLPVIENDMLVGIVSIGDLANATSSKLAAGETIASILESPDTTMPSRAGVRASLNETSDEG